MVVTEEHLNSFLGVPLYAEDEIVGVMNILSRPPHVLDEQDVLLACAIGVHVGSAIQNARLYKKLQEAHAALQEKERYCRMLIDSTNEGFWRITHQYKTLHVNDALCRMLGYSYDDMLTKTPLDVVDADNRKIFEAQLAKAPTTTHRSYDIALRHKNGKAVFVHVNATTLPERQGSFAFVTDITERKKAEEKLRQAELRFRTVADFTYDWEYWETTDGKFAYVSPSCKRITGYEVDNFIKSFLFLEEIILPEDKKSWLENHKKVVEDREKNEIQFRIHRKDGEVRWIEQASQPVFDENGKFIGFRASNRDITQRKKTEEALKISEERHRLFYNPSFGGSIIHDKGLILDCSKGVTNITGYSYNELIGMDGLLLIAPGRRNFVIDKIASGFEDPYETEGIRKDGTIFPLRLHAKTIQYRGKTARVVEFRDITEIKKKEEEIQAARDFLNKVIDLSMFGMWVSDKEGTVIRTNRSLCETVNLTEDKIIGKYNVFEDDNLKSQGVIPKVKAVFEECQPARFTIPWRAAGVSGVDVQSARDMYIDVYMFPILDAQGHLKNVVCQWLDISELKKVELEKDRLIEELKQALAKVKKLEGFLPICCHCKKIRDDLGYWQEVEKYIHERSDAQFSHSVCPECAEKYYSDLNLYDK